VIVGGKNEKPKVQPPPKKLADKKE